MRPVLLGLPQPRARRIPVRELDADGFEAGAQAGFLGIEA
jgi:hypothetical protein